MNQNTTLRVRIETTRGGYVESTSRVSAVVLGPEDAVTLGTGDTEQPVFWRSTAKFIQTLSVLTSGAAERFGLTEREIAIACGSHSGSDEHTAVVQGLLDKIGATADDLHCGPHAPLGPDEAKQLAARGLAPTRLHNNCSGKHAGMLAACRARGWPLADYNRLHHPLQQEIFENLAQVAGVHPKDIQTAVDGCGAVVFRTPLSGIARAFRRLAAGELPEPLREAGLRIRAAIGAAPEMVAGRHRLCTDLMTVSSGRLVAKIGAEGVYALGVRADASSGAGAAALALKIEDGNGKLVAPLACRLAAHVGMLSVAELSQLTRHSEMPILNFQREHVGDVLVRIEAAG